jgi:3-methyladenine DNA glycosylase AlkD
MAMEKAQWEEWAAFAHHIAYKINFYLEKLTFSISEPPKKAHKSTFCTMQLNQSIFGKLGRNCLRAVTFICK